MCPSSNAQKLRLRDTFIHTADKMKTLCTVRDIYRTIRDFENDFQTRHDLCLNEGMMLCSLKMGQLSSTELAEVLGLTTSNTSKVIKSVENKGYIERQLGKDDKRQMYFALNDKGWEKLKELKSNEDAIVALIERVGHSAGF